MYRKLLAVGVMLSATVAVVFAADTTTSPAQMGAAEIVSRNEAARGGLPAWKAVQSLRWEGKLGVGGNQREPVPVSYSQNHQVKIPTDARPKQEIELPFVMEMQRPRKMRFELQFRGQTALQVYDGTNGWKLRPYLNRRVVEPYTQSELQMASTESGLDGPLMDYAAKGTKVDLEGSEKVEGRDTYRLRLTTRAGRTFHIWIDAHTFLETKVEGQPRTLDGREHPVEVYYRDFRSVAGLQVPFVLETHVLPLPSADPRVRPAPIPAEKIQIERVDVNPKLDAALFAKPDPMYGSGKAHE